MKQRLLRILSALLIIFGVGLLLLPQITAYFVEQRSNESVEIVEEIEAVTLQENIKKESTFDFGAIEEIQPSGVFLDVADPSLLIGRIYIPSIELNISLYNGVTNEILNSGAGTMRPGLVMGEGNFPIAGHYSRNDNVLFADLISVEIGDSIFMTDNEKIYEYEVYETRIVPPTAIELIEDDVAKEHGKPIISLMNCYFVGNQNTGDRYFVFGELVQVTDYE